MSQVKINTKIEKPSDAIINDANKLHQFTDSLGRILKVKIPNLQDVMRFDLYFGKYKDENPAFYERAQSLVFFKEVDDMPVSFPTTESEMLALAGRVGIEGMVALQEFAENLSPKTTEDEEKDALKK